MAKVMSLLEKYNLVEKVNKGDSNNTKLKEKEEKVDKQNTNLKEEKDTKSEEELKPENSILKADITASKEEVKKTVVNEKPQITDDNVEYENKIMISDIYSSAGLENSDVNTVFMLQNLINALPQNLPQDVIKQSVMNIIAASNIDLKELVSDGEKRLKVLNKVMNEYNTQTNKRIAKYKEEIDKLAKLINNYEEQIKVKEDMLEDQTYMVKYETQKIDSIMDFFQD